VQRLKGRFIIVMPTVNEITSNIYFVNNQNATATSTPFLHTG